MSRPYHVRFIVLGLVLGMCSLSWAQAVLESGDTQKSPATQPAPAASQPAGPSPRLELSATEFDFGVVWKGTPAEREFTVKNVGEAPLTLSVRSSCGCTVATKPKTPLPPGESTTFKISYKTTTKGKARKTVTLMTNDPDQPQVKIPVHGEVKPLFTGNPQETIFFKGLESNSQESMTIKLENQYGSPVPLTLKKGQNFGRFEIEFKEIEKGEKYELTATTKPPLRNGANRATVMLETGLKEMPKVQIQISSSSAANQPDDRRRHSHALILGPPPRAENRLPKRNRRASPQDYGQPNRPAVSAPSRIA
ncbi:MAG: DUF1573 domain-containing protein [Phycisphaerae bacterium]|nr:DUF1573 domain-containing protein [Phycisphaerae bacterium]